MNWQERADGVEARLREQLLAGLAGDAGAYRLFLGALASHLRAFFRRRLFQAPDEVEDLVQETLLAIHSQRHTYRPELPLTAWAHTIARYKYIDLLRSRSRRDDLHEPLDDHPNLFAVADLDAADAKRDLAALLESLPPKQRQALYLTKVEGASTAEAAAVMGMSEGAIKVSVHRGLKALTQRFGSTR